MREKKIQLLQKSGSFSSDREKEVIIAFSNFSRINDRNTKQELLKKINRKNLKSMEEKKQWIS